MALNARFGKLLSEGIVSVAMRQDKTVKAVEEEIAQELGFASHTIERWRRGYTPRESGQIAFLVRYCAAYGRADRTWAESLLTQSTILIVKRYSGSSSPLLPDEVNSPRSIRTCRHVLAIS